MASCKRAEDGAAPCKRARQRDPARRSRRAGKRAQKRRQRNERRRNRESAEFYRWVYDTMWRTPYNLFTNERLQRQTPREQPNELETGNLNYAPRVDPYLDEHAYSPISTSNDSGTITESHCENPVSDSIKLEIDHSNPIMKEEPNYPNEENEVVEQSIDPPRLPCEQGLYYVPIVDELTSELVLGTSSPLVDELLRTCPTGTFEFVPPPSTVIIREL